MKRGSQDSRSVQELVREEILALNAYEVHDAQGMIKLDAMENPYPLPARAAKEIGATASELAFNRYPDPAAVELKRTLRSATGVPAHAEIVLGNGSDELIQIIAMALAKPGAVLMSVEPSFVMYPRVACYTGMRFVGVRLNPDFSLDFRRLCDSIEQHAPAVLFLAYPNNPTGNLFDREAVLRIVERNPGLTVLDEAYHPFAQSTFMDDLVTHPNLVVMRTLSKLGLAGLRLGFLAGGKDWLTQFEKLRLPYNVGAFSQTAAAIALSDDAALKKQAQAIRNDREAMLRQLRERAITAFDSDANFILFRLPRAHEVFLALKARRVLIKDFALHPMLEDCLRVTVGTPDENRRFFIALDESLREVS